MKAYFKLPLQCLVAFVLLAALSGGGAAEAQSSATEAPVCNTERLSSPYINVDSWIYPAVLRLYALGYVDRIYLGIRPWTRNNLRTMTDQAGARLAADHESGRSEEGADLYNALMREVRLDAGDAACPDARGEARLESAYSEARGVTGTALHDSYHLGESFANDYARPAEEGFNSYTGSSAYLNHGRFTLYARGEFQHAPSGEGYSQTLANQLATLDGTVNYLNTTTAIPLKDLRTIPLGPIAEADRARFLELYASARLLNHQISFGKQDQWLGPGLGSAMAYSNNAENIYGLEINRTEPLYVPGLSRLVGPFRYEFLVGALKGHVYPKDPWMHVEKISMRPTENLEVGFERSVIWGGKDHEPINLHSFLRSFFSTSSALWNTKNSNRDPGARFAAFDVNYRLPYLRNWLTFYVDSEVHDDVSPADAPRRAAIRPGLYLARVPGLAKLDLRAEAAMTDPSVSSSGGGRFMYFEAIERQGYTNQGQLMGDWMGREAKGGQLWLTYHLSGNEWLQLNWRGQKAAKDFIAGGTTINDWQAQIVKRIGRDFEINGRFTSERWLAPIYKPGTQQLTSTSLQLTWYPERKTSF